MVGIFSADLSVRRGKNRSSDSAFSDERDIVKADEAGAGRNGDHEEKSKQKQISSGKKLF